MAEPWGLLVRQANQALLQGRFGQCERLAARAAELAPGEPAPGLLVVAARREQGRPAEAELLARVLVADHPDDAVGQALLGAVLADLGRDADAGRQLDRLVAPEPAAVVPTATISAAGPLAAEIVSVLNLPAAAEALHRTLEARAGQFLDMTGSAARHAGLLCHVLGHWDDAEGHFDAALRANEAAGAPVLAAHTRRQYSALLRARGGDGDWERAIELLAEAASVYRRLEIDRLADESDAVLRRCQDLGDPAGAPATTPVNVFRRTPDGWELSYEGRSATVADSAGLRHLGALLAADGRPIHVVDLAVGPSGAGGSDGVRDQMVAEYRDRLAELDRQLTELDRQLADAAGRADPTAAVAASLARAERDLLAGELASVAPGARASLARGARASLAPGARASLAPGAPAIGVPDAGAPVVGDLGDRARRLVALRIRTGLDRIEDELPALARHLRRGVRTGTFCIYEPERPERWKMGP